MSVGELPEWWPGSNPHIIGDCSKIMPKIPDNSINLTITSPPYDDLRNYEGYNFDFEKTAEELYRITKDSGVVVWIISDATNDGDETGSSFRQALYFKFIGFKLHDTMIWIKDGGGAIGSNKSYTQNFEYMFILVKGNLVTHNLIYDKPNKSFGKDKSGVGRRKKTGEHKIEKRKLSKEFSRRNNYWYIPPERGDHPAVFPEQLVHDHIISWSNEGNIVFDPMLGSGTTIKMAQQLNRVGLGIEISPEYEGTIKERIKQPIRPDHFVTPTEASSRQGVGPAEKPNGLGSDKGMHCQSDKHPKDCSRKLSRTDRAVRDNQLDKFTHPKRGCP